MHVLGKLYKKPGIWSFDVEKPTLGANDVMIRIKKTAICGTDIHIYNWDEWAQATIPVPMITGHEFVGEIVEVGAEVNGFVQGDRVSGEGHINCGHCRNCRAGKRHLCRETQSVGVTRTGCFAEYLVIPAANAFTLPEHISDDIAAIMDPLGNATHTALSFNLVGEDVFITGAGPVGTMAAAIARHAGARHVVLSDVNPYRLELASQFKNIYTFNPMHQDLIEVQKELGIVEGFDVGMEMSGNKQAFNQMIKAMNHGGKIALLGFLPPDTMIDWNQIIMKGLFMKGIYGREMYETWYLMASMLKSGLDITPIITHQFPCTQFQQGFEVMRTGQSGKVILDWT